MPAIDKLPVSRTRARGGGDALRDWWVRGGDTLLRAKLIEHVGVVGTFREAHQVPLTRVAAGLRLLTSPSGG